MTEQEKTGMELHHNAALILIDQQKGILHPRLGPRNNPEAELRMLELLALWRHTARPVIHVPVSYTHLTLPTKA